jgi:hypothetical protein
VLDEPLLTALQKHYADYSEDSSNVVAFLEFFLFSLINRIDKLQQAANMYLNTHAATSFAKIIKHFKAQFRRRRRR